MGEARGNVEFFLRFLRLLAAIPLLALGFNLN